MPHQISNTAQSAVQLEYSPFSLDIESPQIDLLSTCKSLGVAVVAYSPLGRGFLTGQIRSRDDIPEGDFRRVSPRFSEANFPKNMALVRELESVATRKGVTVGQVVLAWLMRQWDMILPIPGSRRADKVEENLRALRVELSDQEDREIREFCEKAEVAGDRYPSGMMAVLFADTPEL